MRIRGIADGRVYWWAANGWTDDESKAKRHTASEADRQLRIINANNRFLDRDERMEAAIVESN